MEAYQAIYDAVRSRINNGDIGQAVEAVMREANVAHYVERAAITITEEAVSAARAHAAPSAMYRPALGIDGDQWCALYGANLQDGIAGFGDSPAEAMRDFDRAWGAKLPTQQASSKAYQVLREHGFPELRAHGIGDE